MDFNWHEQPFYDYEVVYEDDIISIIYLNKDIDFVDQINMPAFLINIRELNVYGAYFYKYQIYICKNTLEIAYIDNYGIVQNFSTEGNVKFSDFVEGKNLHVNVDNFDDLSKYYENNKLNLWLNPDKNKLTNKINSILKLKAFK